MLNPKVPYLPNSIHLHILHKRIQLIHWQFPSPMHPVMFIAKYCPNELDVDFKHHPKLCKLYLFSWKLFRMLLLYD